MTFRIFLSHDADDEHIARWFAGLLEAVFPQALVFLSSRDLRGGGVWPENLRTQLSDASAILVLLTPRALGNLWVHFEGGAGFTDGRTIPLCADGLRPAQLAPPFSLLQARLVDEAGLRKVVGDLATKAEYERNPAEQPHVQKLIADAVAQFPSISFPSGSPEVVRGESQIRVEFGDIERLGCRSGFEFLVQHVALRNDGAGGVTITNLQWTVDPTEVLMAPVTQHVEPDGTVCFGFSTPDGDAVHEPRPAHDRWRFPSDVEPGTELQAIVPVAVRPIREARDSVAKVGFRLAVNVIGGAGAVLSSAETHVLTPSA